MPSLLDNKLYIREEI